MKLEIIEDNWNCFLFGEVNGPLTHNCHLLQTRSHEHKNSKVTIKTKKEAPNFLNSPNFLRNPYYKNEKILLPVKILNLIEM